MKFLLALLSCIPLIAQTYVQPNIEVETGQIFPDYFGAKPKSPGATTVLALENVLTYKVSCEAYGIFPDDGIDDHERMTNALQQLSHGSTLYFPAGTYTFSQGFDIWAEKIEIAGEGSGVTIWSKTGTNIIPYLVKVRGASPNYGYYKSLKGISIHDLGNTCHDVLHLDRIAHSIYYDVYVNGGRASSVLMEGAVLTDFFQFKISNTIGVRAANPPRNNMVVSNISNSINFYGSMFEGASNTCVVVTGGSHIINFFGGTMEGSVAGRGLDIIGHSGVNLVGVDLEACPAGSLLLTNLAAGNIGQGTPAACTFIGTLLQDGINLVNAYGTTFLNCRIGGVTNRVGAVATVINNSFWNVLPGVGALIDESPSSAYLPIINASTAVPTYKYPQVPGGGSVTAPFTVYSGAGTNYYWQLVDRLVGPGNLAFDIIRRNSSVPQVVGMSFDAYGNISLGFTNAVYPAARLSIDGSINIGGQNDAGKDNLYVKGVATAGTLNATSGQINQLTAFRYGSYYGYLQVPSAGVSMVFSSASPTNVLKMDVELVAGANVTITTNGANKLVINSTGGGGGGTNIYYTSNYNNTYYTTNIHVTAVTNLYVTNNLITLNTNNYFITTNVNSYSTNLYQTVTNNIVTVNTNIYHVTTTNNYVTNYVTTTNVYSTNIYNYQYYTENVVKVNGANVANPNFQNSVSHTITATGANITINETVAPMMWFAVTDETTPITTTGVKRTMRAPYKFQIVGPPRASLTTESSSGSPKFDIKKNGATVLSTQITINQGQRTSVGATPPVVLFPVVEDDSEITIDVTVTGTNAKGAKVIIYGYRIP